MPRSWGGRRAVELTRLVLQRDYDDTVGYTPCYWCGRAADTADHWPVARSQGGPDTTAGLISACRPCNSRRGAELVNRSRSVNPPPSRRW